ncbi:MAG: ABC transporter [Actinomycetaceae bacterium]|nr:ABC transporter [Actinomycetaceae bacterium]
METIKIPPPPVRSPIKTHQDEAGSQVVSHVLVQVMVVIVLLGLLQLAYVLHIRNLTLDAASEGARRAALAGATLDEGEQRARDLIEASLGKARIGEVKATEVQVEGVTQVTLTINTSLPVLGPWGLPRSMEIKARAWKE